MKKRKITVSKHSGGHVLFLTPPSDRLLYRGVACTWVSKASYVWQPFDFILLSAIIPPSIKISYIDSVAHKIRLDDVFKFIVDNGVTNLIMSMSSIEWARDLGTLVTIRNEFPRLKIALLGDVFQERPFVEQVLPLVVTIIRHPMDPLIAEYFTKDKIVTSSLLQKLDKDGVNLPPVNPQKDIDLPLPRHEIFLDGKHRSPFDKYKNSTIVNISWGCPFACSYCTWSSPYLPFSFKTAKSVIRELEFLHKLNVREIFFGDLSFGFPVEVVREVLDAMICNNWRFSWHCYIKPGTVSQDMLNIMSKTGCHTIIIGVESSNLELEKFNRYVTQANIASTISICRNLGIEVCGDFILGLNQSVHAWRQLTKFAIKLGLDFASFNIYTPILGSLERYRKIESGAFTAGEWGYDTTAWRKSVVSHAENRLKCIKMFYGRPAFFLRRLLRIRTLDEFLIKLEEALNIFKRMKGGY